MEKELCASASPISSFLLKRVEGVSSDGNGGWAAVGLL